MNDAADPPQLNVARVRADFPILHRRLHEETVPGGVPLVYFDNASTTQRPSAVIQAMVEAYENYYANVHRGIHVLSEASTDRYETAREKTRNFIGAASAEEIVFTRGTTESINLVARSWGDANLRAGDEIVLTEMEHHSNIVPWQQLAERTGAVVRFAPISDSGLLVLDDLERLLGERVRLVAVTAVSNVLGTENPIDQIVSMAHARGALVLVDAAQSIGHRAVDVRSLKVDFLAFSGHKMLGPSGIGVLYGRRELLEAMPPFMGGGSMIRRVRLDGFEAADLPSKFEAGTPSIVPAIGLAAAIDYLQQVGLEAIWAHDRRLCLAAQENLLNVRGLRILGPDPEHKGGVISFVLEKIHAHDVAQLLDRQGIAVRAGHHCAMPLHKRLGVAASARASFYLYNTLEEVERLAEGLEEVKHVFHRQ